MEQSKATEELIKAEKAAQQIADDCRENAEANHIAKGIQLYAEGFFIIGAVLLGAGDAAVKGVADAGNSKAEDRKFIIAVNRTGHAQYGRNQADVCQNDCVIVESDKTHLL